MANARDWEAQLREYRKQWKEWDEICPDGFVDADIKEDMTGKAAPRPEYDKESGESSLNG